jgi:hypothetical protein
VPQDFFLAAHTIYVSVALLYQTTETIKIYLPMDKTSTPEFKINGSVIKQALKSEKFPKPTMTSLELIKNFARNFKVQKNIEGDIRELVLN